MLTLLRRFGHQEFAATTRPSVKTGAVRFARGFKETHDTEYLGDKASEYLRVELKTTAPAGIKNARIAARTATVVDNGQVRIERCRRCGAVNLPSVAVLLTEKSVRFVKAGERVNGKQEFIRIVLKTKPVVG